MGAKTGKVVGSKTAGALTTKQGIQSRVDYGELPRICGQVYVQ